jgi:methionyl-tRNA synthetase
VRRFYLTTAIDFVNSKPHLGTAYEKVCADVIARYHRLIGDETRFQMGNDEHSQNVYKSAVEQRLPPLEYCDRMEEVFTRTWRYLDVSYDDFIRTTEPRHHKGVTALVQRIYDAGDIYEGTYDGWYCEGCEAFKQEKDLVDGKCPLHPTTPLKWIHEKNYFFKLSKFQRPLLEHFSAHPEFLAPEIRRNEILRLIEGGLEDISISRAGQSWGIPLPFDPSSVVYVWFDALANYATAVGLGTDASLLEKWWPASLHVIGKDITRFHTVIWPAMLMSAGLPLPGRVFGHGFMTLNGQRMSKSLGTIVDPIEAADRNGVDPLRLYLVKEISFGHDGDFSWERFDERYNVDLANNLGNLVSRISAMAARYCEGQLWATEASANQLAGTAERASQEYRHAMDALAIHEGAASAFRIVDATNEFIAATTPWTLARDPANGGRVRQALFDASEAVRLAAVLLTPVMPASSAEILRRVGMSGPIEFDRDGRWRTDGRRRLTQDGPLWPRKESKEIRVESNSQPAASPQAPASTPQPPAASPDGRIGIDDFMKVELRVAKVLQAERVPKSTRLLKLLVDVGSEQRTIVAGIAESYEPETLVGRTVVVVFNLKPAKLMGVESNGMVLAASPEGGKATIVSFDEPPAPGTRVR